MQVTNIRAIYKIAVKYVEERNHLFDQSRKEISIELKRRIKRLENDYNRLIFINNFLCEAKLPKTHFDESTGVMSTTINGSTLSIQYNRADPNVPVKLADSSILCAYFPDDSIDGKESDLISEFKMEMEQLIEQYYNSAFRITKLIQELTGRKNYDCREITIIRNKLVEHPESGSIYSFGYGSNGPIIKPIYRGQQEWRDSGLVPNTLAFIKSIKNILTCKDLKS